jgi:hypothetical protein
MGIEEMKRISGMVVAIAAGFSAQPGEIDVAPKDGSNILITTTRSYMILVDC